MVRTEGRFIGAHDRPLAAWLSTPDGGGGSRGAIVAPPLGYEYWTAHRTLRVVAERLAAAGIVTLRLDYDGTGDSAGDHLDPGRVAAWRASLHAAADELRRLGCNQLLGVGMRLGAALLVEEGAGLGLDELVCWAPVESGKRFGRELRMVATPFPEDVADPGLAGAVSLYGIGLRADELAALARLDPAGVTTRPAERVLILDRADRPTSDKLRQRLEDVGAKVEHEQVGGTEKVLDVSTETAAVPEEIVERIVAFASGEHAAARPLPPGRTSATFSWAGGQVREEHVRIGATGFVGVFTRTLATPAKALVVFLNSGSEHHVGPGRGWVELARTLAVAGYDALRVDFTGWGESPDAGHAPGRPYAPHVTEDARQIVAALREAGEQRIVLAGLCSGGWIALAIAPEVPLEGVIAFNPWVNHYEGDTIYDTPTEAARELTGRRNRQRVMRQLGIWEILEALAIRNTGGRLLARLRRAGVPTLYVFAEDDLSEEWLNNRVPRSWRLARRVRGVESVTFPDLDHAMFRIWHRPAVYERIRRYLDEFVAPPRTP